ncbi:hypothetical protein BDN70DRAFT_873724 [Pholiota conissans]|uniref:DUF6533 domain-containing protein n=1 Tax=Pholiota conissans TaxID=109636 RepID=A0A9P5ZA75_9AGAR|nr:hypothetical protein BDN70DRAFT_873724 [Pholiota conissans]
MASAPLQLPNELNLSPHLSAHKYFLVCTLTVAAWDTLVLSPRTWRLFKMPGWPALKILFHFLRLWMPAEFIVVAVGFFDTKLSPEQCQKFFLFEPIATAILLACTSAVHVIRIHAIYDSKRPILILMSALYALQIVVTGIAAGFYRSVPLLSGQGCIAGPKHEWVGIYWVAPTLLYTVSFALALHRSIDSLKTRAISKWKLMLRDGLNLYGAIWLVNTINMLFYFIATPTDTADPIKTIVTSMAAVLTTSMTLRIILSVRGTLVHGGSFALSASASGQTSSHNTNGAGTAGGRHGPTATTFSAAGFAGTGTGRGHGTFEIRAGAKAEGDWAMGDDDVKGGVVREDSEADRVTVVKVGGIADLDGDDDGRGVKVTVDREIGYDASERYRK